jgi:hypothetical protein
MPYADVKSRLLVAFDPVTKGSTHFAMFVFDVLGLFQEFPRFFPLVFRAP